VLVLGDQVVNGMYRVVSGGSWKTHISLGAEPKPLKITAELEELAIKATKILGLDYAGVDIIETKNSGYLVLEVNAAPSWEGLQKVTPFSISDKIVNYLLDKLKR